MSEDVAQTTATKPAVARKPVKAAPKPTPVATGDTDPGKVMPPERRKEPRFIPYRPALYYSLTFLPVVLLVGGSFPFNHFIVEVIIANPILNGLILGVLALGAAVIMQRVWGVQKQFKILDRFMKAYKEGRPFTEVLNEPAIYYSGVGHVIVHVAETEGRISSGLTQTAINDELDHFQHHFQAGYEVPNYIVGFMIAMGLTGTFIGLLETMIGISAMLGGINTGGGDMSEAVMGLITQLQKPLEGMGTAFSASLFGLIGSVALGMMMLGLKHSVNQLMSAMRRYINGVVEHDIALTPAPQGKSSGRESRGRGMSDSAMSQFINEIVESNAQTQEAIRQGQEYSMALGARIDKLADSLQGVGEMIKGQVDATKKTNDLLSFGPRMRDLAEESLTETRKLFDIQKQQASTVSDSIKAIGQLEQRINTVNMNLSELAQWMASDSQAKQVHAKSLLSAVVTLQERTTQVAQESEQTRNVNIDMARHLSASAEAQKKLIDLLGFGGRMRDIADQQLSELKILNSLQRESSGNTDQLAALLGSLDQRFVRIDGQLAQWASEVSTQSDAQRKELRALVESFASIQEQMALVARESQQNRNVSIDIARHLTEANHNLLSLKSGNEVLGKINEGAANQIGVLNALVNEVRSAKTSMIRDIKGEFRGLAEVLARQDEDDESAYDEDYESSEEEA